jgi:uncharacterized membrane protein
MLQNQLNTEVAVDRREEIVRTEQPGYTSTQQVTQDVAGTRRLQLFQITRMMWLVLGLLEIMLGLRFILKLMAANSDNGFAGFVYGISGAFTKPFDALLGTPAIDGSIFETTTLIAMCVYAFLFGLAARLLIIIGDRPRARSVARSVQEQTPSRAAAISVDRIDRADQPVIISTVKLPLPIAVNPAKEDSLLRAYAEFLRRYQRTMDTIAAGLRARVSLRSVQAKMLNTEADLSLGRTARTDQAEIINVEQLPGDLRLDQIARTDQAEIINVEQLPGDLRLDQIERTDRAEIINVEPQPANVSLGQIDHADQPWIIRSVKLPSVVDSAQRGPRLHAYSNLVHRHRYSIGLPEPKIFLT